VILRFTVFFVSLFLCVNVFSQIHTNEQIVEFKTIELLDSIAIKLPDSLTTVAIEINSNDREVKSYLLNQFAQYFTKKKITVSLDSAASKVVFENFDVVTEYEETKKGMLGFSSNIKRRIIFTAEGFVINNELLDVAGLIRCKSIYKDIVKTSDLNLIENSKYEFCHGKMMRASNWTKYIEPGIVIASVAGIVLLLFTMRF